ncbi:hypothetical protein ACQP1K_21390 [Sphaerimonospora sp. CA-214678]|uniref:hypothetical protein n=1 Tax=Sphaerimonospora sp. CA-214678 TaxID=3240029 RepID=UPI003D8BCD32
MTVRISATIDAGDGGEIAPAARWDVRAADIRPSTADREKREERRERLRGHGEPGRPHSIQDRLGAA